MGLYIKYTSSGANLPYKGFSEMVCDIKPLLYNYGLFVEATGFDTDIILYYQIRISTPNVMYSALKFSLKLQNNPAITMIVITMNCLF